MKGYSGWYTKRRGENEMKKKKNKIEERMFRIYLFIYFYLVSEHCSQNITSPIHG
jgi:hypothetical protein